MTALLHAARTVWAAIRDENNRETVEFAAFLLVLALIAAAALVVSVAITP